MIGFENPIFLIALIGLTPIIYLFYRAENRFEQFLTGSKFLTVLFVVMALSSPFIETEEHVEEESRLVILEDNTVSNELLEDIEPDFEDAEIERRVLATGNNSNLRNGMMRNLEEDTSYLVLSDLQSDQEIKDLSEDFNSRNSTLNLLETETKDDISVRIEGPSSTVTGVENQYNVIVESTNSEKPVPQVKHNGEPINLNKEGSDGVWSFEKSFDTDQVQRLEAEVDYDGYFEGNQEYYKAVDIRGKPEILVLGEDQGLGQQLEDFYTVSRAENIPNDLSDYYSVVATESFPEEELTDFVAEGNGLVYTGETKDKDLLPVRPVEDDDDTDGAKIMLAIDVSPSIGRCVDETIIDGVTVCSQHEAEGGAVEESIRIAHSLVSQLSANNEVGAVVYDTEAHAISEPEPLALNRDQLLEDLSKVETENTAFHHKGLKGAEELIDSDEGNIIMITDGRISRYADRVETQTQTQSTASQLDQELITVGVGEPINERFLQDLAEQRSGVYLNADERSRLNFMFDAGGAEDTTGKLGVVNPHHFITEGFETNAQTLGYESVEPKRGSDLLVSSAEQDEFLTTWNYGLGRVATFTGDDNQLSNTMNQDPDMATRTVSWTVGNPERKEDEFLNIENSRKNQKVNIRSSENLENLTRTGENLYTGELKPETTGFHKYHGKTYSYNYNNEKEKIGYREDNKDLIRETGGQVYQLGEEEQIASNLEDNEERTVTSEKSLTRILLIGALIIFLFEVGYRKLKGRK